MGAPLALDFVVAAAIIGGMVAREATNLVLGIGSAARQPYSVVPTPRMPSDAAMVRAWELVKEEMGTIDRPPKREELDELERRAMALVRSWGY